MSVQYIPSLSRRLTVSGPYGTTLIRGPFTSWEKKAPQVRRPGRLRRAVAGGRGKNPPLPRLYYPSPAESSVACEVCW